VYSTEHPFPDDDWLREAAATRPSTRSSGSPSPRPRRASALTNLCVLPYRNPFLAARAAASLDVLSGGRLDLGVGAG
jgi:alkanesulfonate monooxygenase SsuD/methylene tetrahydromethanopterin reductase-like flavin-dependent oxidoreductase (luciferase family)